MAKSFEPERDSLLPSYTQTFNPSAKEAKLVFFDNLLAKKTLAEVEQVTGVGLTPLAGGVERVGGQAVGRLRVEFPELIDESSFTDVVDFLKQRGVRVEHS